MQKVQLLQVQSDLTRKQQLNDYLIYQLKSGTMTMNEKNAIKKAIECFTVTIGQLQRTIDIEVKKEVSR